jgi:hypothetical protein
VDTASFVKRFALVAVLPALTFAAPAGAAAERAAAVSLTGPHRIVQGGDVRFTASVRPSGSRCSLSVRYRTGTQRAGTVTAGGGEATFQFKVARRAAPGRARATVSCAGAGRASLSLMVIGSVIPPNIRVLKQGFSIRPRPYGGADTSWGVIVKNDSPTRDALDVTILANYVMPDNRLIGSMTVRVGRIPAGKEYATGGDLPFRDVPPVARLEIVAQIRDSAPADRRLPGVANVRILSDRYDPALVASVEGEVVNDNARSRLQGTELSTVVLDAAGNILGGGKGYSIASLPPGSRQFFVISGMRAVSFGQATTAIVSVSPTYER